jgi:hypothetical protein
LGPDITDILKVAKKDSKKREGLSMQKSQLTSSSLTQTTQLHDTMFVTKKTTYNCSPDKNSDKTTNELLLNISSVIKSALTFVQKIINNSKRLSQGAINELQTTHEGANFLTALVNQRHRTNFGGLEINACALANQS